MSIRIPWRQALAMLGRWLANTDSEQAGQTPTTDEALAPSPPTKTPAPRPETHHG